MDSTRRGHADPQPVFALRAAPVTLPLRLVWLRRSICALTGFGATAFATKGLPSRSLRSKRRIGGPGRTRTCNQTVMSAVPYRKIRANSVCIVLDRAHSCTFVHEVSVGFLVGATRPGGTRLGATTHGLPRRPPTDHALRSLSASP